MCCFVTIPGSGKTALMAGLEERLRSLRVGGGSGRAAAATAAATSRAAADPVLLKLLNGDQMKAKGSQVGRRSMGIIDGLGGCVPPQLFLPVLAPPLFCIAGA